MLVLAAALLVVYAFVNVLGAWAVTRRKGWLTWLFMLAAAALVLAAVTLLTALPASRVLIAAALALTSLASYLNARLVLGRALPLNHAVRALVALGIFGLAHLALLNAGL